MGGFISIERDLWDHPLFTPAPMTEREAWIWMVSRAAWAETRHRVGSELVTIQRGSFMATLREMQSVFMWGSDKRVRTFLSTLEKEGMIGRTTLGAKNAPKTHVTICNYDEYQSSGRTKDAPKTQERTHHGRTADALKKQDNNITRDTNVSIKTPRKSQIPPDAVLSEKQSAIAADHGHCDQEAEAQFGKFKDYCLANGKSYIDWNAAWRNWLTSPYFQPALKGTANDNRNRYENSPDRKGQRPDAALENIARLAGLS